MAHHNLHTFTSTFFLSMGLMTSPTWEPCSWSSCSSSRNRRTRRGPGFGYGKLDYITFVLLNRIQWHSLLTCSTLHWPMTVG